MSWDPDPARALKRLCPNNLFKTSMLAAPDGLWTTGKSFTGAHTGTLNILNQRKPRLNQNMNRRGLHRKLFLCLCETDPYLQLVPRPVTTWLSAMQQLLDATDTTKLLFWIMRTSLSSRTQDLHVCCLPALPRGLPVPASCSPSLPASSSLESGGVSTPKGAQLLPGKEESLLSGKAKATLLPAACAWHFGRMGAEQILS